MAASAEVLMSKLESQYIFFDFILNFYSPLPQINCSYNQFLNSRPSTKMFCAS